MFIFAIGKKWNNGNILWKYRTLYGYQQGIVGHLKDLLCSFVPKGVKIEVNYCFQVTHILYINSHRNSLLIVDMYHTTFVKKGRKINLRPGRSFVEKKITTITASSIEKKLPQSTRMNAAKAVYIFKICGF